MAAKNKSVLSSPDHTNPFFVVIEFDEDYDLNKIANRLHNVESADNNWVSNISSTEL